MSPATLPLKAFRAAALAILLTGSCGPTDSGGDVPASPEDAVVPLDASGTPGEEPAIVPEPLPVDFGNVPCGTSQDLEVVLRNVRLDAVSVDEVLLHAEGSPDFSIQYPLRHEDGTPAGLPVSLEPQAGIRVVLRYSPVQGGCRYTSLRVRVAGQSAALAWDVAGCAPLPRLVVSPAQIDFGVVEPGETKTVPLTLANGGSSDLVLPSGSVVVAPGSTDPNLAVDAAPPAGATIAPGTSLDAQVSWKAPPSKVINGAPIGYIAVSSNDPAGVAAVPVFGEVAVPRLVLVPEKVDFRSVGPGIQAEQVLSIRNGGFGDLVVTGLSLEGDASGTFAIVEDPGFPPSSGAGQAVIAGLEAREVRLTFTNAGGESGHVEARLVVATNVEDALKAEVVLTADRVDEATCEPVLAPDSADYGLVPVGGSKELALGLRNDGSGYCSFMAARAIDCTGMPPMPTTCGDPTMGSQSPIFSITSVPAATLNGIRPGQTVPIKVRFTPSTTPISFDFSGERAGLLGVKVYDSQLQNEILLPAWPCTSGVSGPSCPPNLNASSGPVQILVLPDKVRFGPVTLGCGSRPFDICIYNTGAAPLEVSDIGAAGCSAAFRIEPPPLPQNVSPDAPLCFPATYAPLDASTNACTVTIESSDPWTPSASIILEGNGTLDDDRVDAFVSWSGQKVDVLFVIDDSGSMCEEQDRLIAGYDSFISQSKVWNNDYHVGVISVNVVDEKVMGRLNRGYSWVTPRYIHGDDPDSVAQFAELADLGCDGGSDAQEAASQAAHLALSAPLTTDTGIACSSDTECANNTTLCGNPGICPYYCIDGACGGWNKGFLRPDAQLEIIVLSDEEDQSYSNPDFYVDFFTTIKSNVKLGGMHFNAIVGPKGGCSAPDGGAADAGIRYLDIAAQTNGKVGSICDADYGPILAEIGQVAFGPNVQYVLSGLAAPTTVRVRANGADCQSGWTYDAPSNRVVIDTAGPCKPQPGDTFEVRYKSLCLPPPE